MKPKLLCILHYSPPIHGASKVGDFIRSNEKLDEEFDCRFIKIKSSDTIGDIGKISLKKIYLVIELFFKTLFTILVFRPQKIYFTASIRDVAFYRDLLLSSIWKLYGKFRSCEVYYHYHTKGIDDFVSESNKNLKLTQFFLNDINIILLSPLLEKDFLKVKTYKDIHYLPNGAENSYSNSSFESYISKKDFNTINILFLSHMIKTKGYFHILKLANSYEKRKYHFHFAGGWQNEKDKKDFFSYIREKSLEEVVTFHGFVMGREKKDLFQKSHILLFPTNFEAFGLVIVEAFSYGIPVIGTDEGSIPYILDDKSGIVIKDIGELSESLDKAIEELVNIESAKYCRKRYLDNFSLDIFQRNFIKILNK